MSLIWTGFVSTGINKSLSRRVKRYRVSRELYLPLPLDVGKPRVFTLWADRGNTRRLPRRLRFKL